jgi:hypothetical protein
MNQEKLPLLKTKRIISLQKTQFPRRNDFSLTLQNPQELRRDKMEKRRVEEKNFSQRNQNCHVCKFIY